jgi:hypothetical protein
VYALKEYIEALEVRLLAVLPSCWERAA